MVAEMTNERMGQTVAGAAAISILLLLIVSMAMVQQIYVYKIKALDWR